MTKLEILLRFQRNHPEKFDEVLAEYYQDKPEWLEFQRKVVEPTKNMGDLTGRQLLFIISMRVLEMGQDI